MKLVEPDGEVYKLEGETITIGRTANNTITIDDSRVSNHHATIRRQENGAHVLYDEGSTNGTRLNSQPVTKPVLLQDGDTVDLGGLVLRYETPVEEAGPTKLPYDENATMADEQPTPVVLRTQIEELAAKAVRKLTEPAKRRGEKVGTCSRCRGTGRVEEIVLPSGIQGKIRGDEIVIQRSDGPVIRPIPAKWRRMVNCPVCKGTGKVTRIE